MRQEDGKIVCSYKGCDSQEITYHAALIIGNKIPYIEDFDTCSKHKEGTKSLLKGLPELFQTLQYGYEYIENPNFRSDGFECRVCGSRKYQELGDSGYIRKFQCYECSVRFSNLDKFTVKKKEEIRDGKIEDL